MIGSGLRDRITYALLSFALFAIGTTLSMAQDNCLNCHDDVEFSSSAHPDLQCSDCHTNITSRHRREGVEPLTDELSCNQCHSRIQRTINRSVHENNAACGDCHGAPHAIHKVEELASAVSPVNQIRSCGGCHDDPPELINGYLTSEHGHALLKAGLINAPSCSDCHGGHQILAVDSDRADTSHAKSPEMCGACHVLILDEWKEDSAHGLAWQAGEEGPVCVDCHSSHRIIEATSAQNRLQSAETCGDCHADYLQTFRDSFHGKANELGFVEGANCADCHTPHKNLGVDDPRSSVHPDNLETTCGACHENVTANILSFNPHSDPKDPEQDFRVFVVWVFMTGLLIGVFAFFGLHDALWLQRALVGTLRGEFREPEATSGQYVRRFNSMNIHIHLTIVVTFLLLALTGLPLKFHDTDWAQALMRLLGGVESAGLIHRIAAIGTFGYAIFHLGNLFVRLFIKREKGMLWGPNSMVPQPQDIRDILSNIRYFLYFGDRPGNDRWNYIEKFDYLAVFWGVLIIGTSGLFLWFPMFFTTFLPGWVLNAAYVIHSDEALLATGFIFIFHFFHTHLRPETFPMDIVVFTGKMSLERFREERPREYQRLVDNNELDDYLVDPPTPKQVRTAYVFGTIALSIGVMLAVGIIWALLTHW